MADFTFSNFVDNDGGNDWWGEIKKNVESDFADTINGFVLWQCQILKWNDNRTVVE